MRKEKWEKDNRGWRNYESRIYGILHILILLLSVFLIITISIDTFHNISFLNQGNYMEIQLWICSFFMFDFWLELFYPIINGNILETDLSFSRIDTLFEYIFLFEFKFFFRDLLFSSVYSVSEKRICFGYRGRVVIL